MESWNRTVDKNALYINGIILPPLVYRVRGLVVEVDCNNQVSAHTAADPGSPVSILHNSPFYSPVKQTVTPGPFSPASLASSNRSTPFMEAIIGNSNVCSDDPDEVESINQDDPQEVTNDSDEGIESEEGGEDIDGEAFKQLIRLFNEKYIITCYLSPT